MLGGVLLAMIVLLSGYYAYDRTPWEAVIRLQADTVGEAQLYYRVDRSFQEKHTVFRTIPVMGEVVELGFPLPAKRIRQLRLDPLQGEGRVIIESLIVRRRDGAEMQAIPLTAFLATHQIDSLEFSSLGLVVTTAAGASDPFLLLEMKYPLTPPGWMQRFSSGRFASALGVCLVAWLVGGWFYRVRIRANGLVKSLAGRTRNRWVMAGFIFLLVLGSRFWVIDHFGVDMPYWDQWDADGGALFVPLLEDRFEWASLLRSHNEHRIAPTRLVSLFSLWLTDTWDARLICVISAVIPALLAGFLCAAFWSILQDWRAKMIWVAALAMVFAWPFNWVNIVAGFQSQFHFFIFFGILGIALMVRSNPVTSASWWGGVFCGVVAVLSMGAGIAGLMAAAALFFILAVRGWFLQADWKASLGAFCFLALLVVVGLLSMPSTDVHDHYHARNVPELISVTLANLAWPLSGQPWLAFLLWSPFLLWSLLYLGGRWPDSWRERFLLGLGLWCGVVAVGAAYARGHGTELPNPRYADPHSLNVLVNIVAMLLLWERSDRREVLGFWLKGERMAWLVRIGGVGVAGLYLYGVGGLTFKAMGDDLPARKMEMRVQRNNAADFLISPERVEVASLSFREWIFPYRDFSLRILDHPGIRGILPVGVAPPIHWVVEAEQMAGFRKNGIPISYPLPRGELIWGAFGEEDVRTDTAVLLASGTRKSTRGAEIAYFHATFSVPENRHWIVFDHAGWSRPSHQRIFLRNRSSGTFTELTLPKVIQYPFGWRRLTAPVLPGVEYDFVAWANTDRFGWMAFTQPRAMHRLSRGVERLTELGYPLMFFSLIGMSASFRGMRNHAVKNAGLE